MTDLVVDTSAVMAVLQADLEAELFAQAMSAASGLRMAAPTWLEVALVATGRSGEEGYRALTAFLEYVGIEVVPVDQPLVEIAYAGWLRYGKGRHPAGLNYGDCFAYALARQRGESLLFKGGDFSLTDIQAAIQPTS